MRLPVHIWIREENACAKEVSGYLVELARYLDERPRKMRLVIHASVPVSFDFDPKDGNPSVTVGGETHKFNLRHRWIPEHPVPLLLGPADTDSGSVPNAQGSVPKRRRRIVLLIDPVDSNRFRVRARRELIVPDCAYALFALLGTIAAITLHPAAFIATAVLLSLFFGKRLMDRMAVRTAGRSLRPSLDGKLRTALAGLAICLAMGGASAATDAYGAIPSDSAASVRRWRPSRRWHGFNLLGMFCQTKMEAGDTRIRGCFPEDHFLWMHEWGFNFARLPLDYRFFVEKGDWMKPSESQLRKLDEAVRYGRRHGIHVQINFHRAPGYCCNPPQEPKSLFRDREPLVAFTNMWSVLAKRYRGIPNEELSFDLLNEPAPVKFYGATPSNYAVVARAAFAAIRSADEDRFIMSDGWRWGIEPVMELHPFDHASGESIHCYEPHALTHYRVFRPDDRRPCPAWPPQGWTNGVEWLERNCVNVWRPAIDDGSFLFVGEFGCYQPTVPHATYLAWLEDALTMCESHGWGWALWNIDGKFGIMDTQRTDCEFEDFHGHKLDRKALDLLVKFAKAGENP